MLCVISMMVLRCVLPDPLQLEVHALARQRIERAERLVHQQDLRIARQRPADAGALLHAAGQLVGISVAEFAKPGHRKQPVDAIVGRRVTDRRRAAAGARSHAR